MIMTEINDGTDAVLINPYDKTIFLKPLEPATLEEDLEKLSFGIYTFTPVSVVANGEPARSAVRVYSPQWYRHDQHNPGLALLINTTPTGELQLEMFVPLNGGNDWEKVPEKVAATKIEEYDLIQPLDMFFKWVNGLL